MSLSCGDSCCPPPTGGNGGHDRTVTRILWLALGVNAAMFAVEIASSLLSGSVALQADALDFLADAGNYAITLGVAGAAVTWRARASMIKGATMALFGLAVLVSAGLNLAQGTVPHAQTMGVIGTLALAANLGVALTMFRFRGEESNLRSAWICSRNDAIGNIAVLLAALGVFGTGSGWPDAIVALIMASLYLTGAAQVIRQASGELAEA